MLYQIPLISRKPKSHFSHNYGVVSWITKIQAYVYFNVARQEDNMLIGSPWKLELEDIYAILIIGSQFIYYVKDTLLTWKNEPMKMFSCIYFAG